MQETILVTGALGNVGAAVAKNLLAAGCKVRLADVDTARLLERFGPAVDAVRFAFEDPQTYQPAFDGVQRMFLMRPPQIANVKRDMFPALDAARAAGVRHFVFLSLIGIEQNPQVPHYQVEQYLKTCGAAHTFLRASFFMQNLSGTHRAEIAARDEIYLPVGKGKTSFIDVGDIGAVGAKALSEPGHENQAYDLTGPRALDYDEVAAIFSEVLGRRITYRNPNMAAFVLRQVRQGTPLMFTLVMAYLYNNTRRGMAEQVTGEVERLLGRKPIDLRRFVEDHRSCWER